MKTFPLFLIMAVTVWFAQTSQAEVTEQDALTEAQHDYIRGDMDAAKERFEFVLQLDPHNVTAQNYLRMIATAENASDNNGELEKALKALVIPHLQLKAATFDSALLYLKQTAEKASNGKTKVSFVVEVPDDAVARAKVSLDLSNIPFTEVLHYMSEQTGFKFKIEKYAITVKLPSAPAPVSSGSETPAPEDTTPTTGMK